MSLSSISVEYNQYYCSGCLCPKQLASLACSYAPRYTQMVRSRTAGISFLRVSWEQHGINKQVANQTNANACKTVCVVVAGHSECAATGTKYNQLQIQWFRSLRFSQRFEMRNDPAVVEVFISLLHATSGSVIPYNTGLLSSCLLQIEAQHHPKSSCCCYCGVVVNRVAFLLIRKLQPLLWAAMCSSPAGCVG